MSSPSHALIFVSQSSETHFDLDRAAELSGMHPEMIVEFLRAGVIHPTGDESEAGLQFDQTMIGRMRQIEHLRTNENISLRLICHIVRVLDRLEDSERELRILRERWR